MIYENDRNPHCMLAAGHEGAADFWPKCLLPI